MLEGDWLSKPVEEGVLLDGVEEADLGAVSEAGVSTPLAMSEMVFRPSFSSKSLNNGWLSKSLALGRLTGAMSRQESTNCWNWGDTLLAASKGGFFFEVKKLIILNALR